MPIIHQHNHRRILFTTLALYAVTLAVGIYTGHLHQIHGHTGDLAPRELGWVPLVLFIILPFVAIAAVFKYELVLHRSLRSLMFLGLTVGAYFVFIHAFELDHITRWPVLTIAFMLFVGIVRRVYSQNFGVCVGIAGIAAVLGLYFPPLVAAVVLMIAALYDFYSVYRSRNMLRVAGEMFHSGTLFGFIVPSRWSEWLLPMSKALRDDDMMILGSGDIGLPLMMSVSLLNQSVTAAVVSAAFSLLGVGLLHWLFFIRRTGERPIAALPPVVICTLLGYAIVVLLKL